MENFDDEQPEAKAHENGAAEANGSARSGGSGNRFSSAAKRDMSGFGPDVSSEVSSNFSSNFASNFSGSAIGWLTSKKRALSITYAVCCVLLVFVVGLASGVPFWLVLLRSILFAAVSFAAAMVVFMVLEKKLLDPPLEGAAAGAPAGLGVREDAFASAADEYDAAAETAPAAQPQNPSTTQAIGAKNSARAGFTRGSAVNIAVGDEPPAEHEAKQEHKAAGAAHETENSSAAHSFEALSAKPTDAAPVNASKVGYNMRNIFNSAKERNVSHVNTSEELKKSRQALSSDPQKFGLALRRWLQDT